MISKRKCLVCGKIYEYCKGCNYETPSWKSIFDSQNCHDIFEVVASTKSDSEKNAALSCLDLSGLEKFDDDIKAQINAIQGGGSPVSEAYSHNETVEDRSEQVRVPRWFAGE